MTGPLLLAGVALALAAVGHWWLPRTKWPHRAPMLGIVAWQTLTASLAFTVFLVGVNLALPGLSAVSTLGELARACTVELSRQFSTPEGALTSTVGLMLAATVSLRCLVALVHEVRATSSLRGAHRVALAAVGAHLTEITSRVTGGAAEDVLLIDSPEAAVFCIPGGGWPARGRGRSATIVMTRGATLALNVSELELVLVHERAHLRARHDRVVVVAHALARAFSWLPVFSVAAKQISCLAEMHADDAVTRAERP